MVNAGLAAAGAAYAVRKGVPAADAAPIIAAFLLQISFYLVPAFPEARAYVEARLSRAGIAVLAVAAAAASYLVYSLPTGVFRAAGLIELAAIAAVPAFVFVLWPAVTPGLTWQDAIALGAIAGADLSKVFRRIYLSPIEGLHVEFLGRIMMAGVGALAYLSIRRIGHTGYQLWTPGKSWKVGLKYFALLIPVAVAAGVGIGFAGFQPVRLDGWLYPFWTIATFAGSYAFLALYEEFFFRGVVQNLSAHSLKNPALAQAFTSIIFGACHLAWRRFPNWRFAALAAIAGWFFGQAYRQRRSVVDSAVSHALVVTTWRMLFRA